MNYTQVFTYICRYEKFEGKQEEKEIKQDSQQKAQAMKKILRDISKTFSLEEEGGLFFVINFIQNEKAENVADQLSNCFSVHKNEQKYFDLYFRGRKRRKEDCFQRSVIIDAECIDVKQMLKNKKKKMGVGEIYKQTQQLIKTSMERTFKLAKDCIGAKYFPYFFRALNKMIEYFGPIGFVKNQKRKMQEQICNNAKGLINSLRTSKNESKYIEAKKWIEIVELFEGQTYHLDVKNQLKQLREQFMKKLSEQNMKKILLFSQHLDGSIKDEVLKKLQVDLNDKYDEIHHYQQCNDLNLLLEYDRLYQFSCWLGGKKKEFDYMKMIQSIIKELLKVTKGILKQRPQQKGSNNENAMLLQIGNMMKKMLKEKGNFNESLSQDKAKGKEYDYQALSHKNCQKLGEIFKLLKQNAKMNINEGSKRVLETFQKVKYLIQDYVSYSRKDIDNKLQKVIKDLPTEQKELRENHFERLSYLDFHTNLIYCNINSNINILYHV